MILAADSGTEPAAEEAWQGCQRSELCSKAPGHIGACNKNLELSMRRVTHISPVLTAVASGRVVPTTTARTLQPWAAPIQQPAAQRSAAQRSLAPLPDQLSSAIGTHHTPQLSPKTVAAGGSFGGPSIIACAAAAILASLDSSSQPQPTLAASVTSGDRTAGNALAAPGQKLSQALLPPFAFSSPQLPIMPLRLALPAPRPLPPAGMPLATGVPADPAVRPLRKKGAVQYHI